MSTPDKYCEGVQQSKNLVQEILLQKGRASSNITIESGESKSSQVPTFTDEMTGESGLEDGSTTVTNVEFKPAKTNNLQSLAEIREFRQKQLERKESVDSFNENGTDIKKNSKPFFSSLFSNILSKKEKFIPEDSEGDVNADEELATDLIEKYHTTHSREASQGSMNSELSSWYVELQNGYINAKASLMKSVTEEEDDGFPDWDFWGQVINDYEKVLKQNPKKFTRNLEKGIPQPIRGMMWQLMSGSKNEELEELYGALLLRKSRHEKIISRDLARTFPNHEKFQDDQGPGQQSLFNVLKCYSIYDEEVGYCQGMPFIVGPLLLNMPEEQAFCVLVKLMDDYSFRTIFTPKMIGLQQRNYQFDKLIQENVPKVHNHLLEQEIKSTMYASQWFMTLFAYRFPLEVVFRIYDIIFAQGEDAVLKFAVALIKSNQDTIILLEFEKLLDYLKDGLFDKYVNNITLLVNDASKIHIGSKKLKKWANEFMEELRKQEPDYLECVKLRQEIQSLKQRIKKQDRLYEDLNKENVDLLNKYIKIVGDMESVMEKNHLLEKKVDDLTKILASERLVIESEFKVS